jgi:hypothetical protein
VVDDLAAPDESSSPPPPEKLMDETDTHTQDGSTSAPSARRPALRGRRRIVALAVGVSVLAGAGAWAATQTLSGETKAGDGVRRTDITSLTERMPALAIGQSAVWYSGWMEGRGEAEDQPAPTWMDAVVTLPEGRAGDLASAYTTAPARERPDVVDDLDGDVPVGELQTSMALDRALSTEYWHATAYLSVETDQLVLVVEGQTATP